MNLENLKRLIQTDTRVKAVFAVLDKMRRHPSRTDIGPRFRKTVKAAGSDMTSRDIEDAFREIQSLGFGKVHIPANTVNHSPSFHWSVKLSLLIRSLRVLSVQPQIPRRIFVPIKPGGVVKIEISESLTRDEIYFAFDLARDTVRDAAA